MSRAVKSWLIFIAILGLILLLNWLLPSVIQPKTQAELPHDTLDEYMIGAKAKRFNKDGALTEQISIDAVYHIQGEEFMVLKSPELVLHRDKLTWTVTASSGKSFINHDNIFQKVDLHNDVEITLEQESPDNWRLLTDQLSVYPKQELASTLSPVSLYSGNLLIESIGMEGYLKLGQVTLNQEVSSIYEVPKI